MPHDELRKWRFACATSLCAIEVETLDSPVVAAP